MREIRQSGLAGGEADSIGLPYPDKKRFFLCFVIRHWNFEFDSEFDFRPSNFTPKLTSSASIPHRKTPHPGFLPELPG